MNPHVTYCMAPGEISHYAQFSEFSLAEQVAWLVWNTDLAGEVVLYRTDGKPERVWHRSKFVRLTKPSR